MRICEIVNRYLKENHISQRQFAKDCGISYSTISLIVSDKPISPTLRTLNAIAKGMNTDIDSLFDLMDDDVMVTVTNNVQSVSNTFKLTEDEKALIIAYRNHPEMQNAVNTLLDIVPTKEKEVYA